MWLTNIYNPYLTDSIDHVLTYDGQSRDAAWMRQKYWLRDKIIGDPMPSDTYTVEQLKAMNYVGVYTKE